MPLLVAVGLVSFNLWITDQGPYLGFYVDFPVWTTPANMIPADGAGRPVLAPGVPRWP